MGIPRAVVYCRISKDIEGAGLGVGRQEQACRELCEREDLDVVAVLVDNDISGYSGKPRPGWSQAADMIKNGEVDVLVGWAVDRFTRHPRELEDLVDLLNGAKVRARTVTGGEIDLSTSDGRMVARIIGSMARHESERKSERQRAKARQLAEAGAVSGGGTRPFGFEVDRVTVRPDEAATIREAAARVLAGEALHSIVLDFAARRILTPAGRDWSTMSLRRMLISARIAGLREHRGRVVAAAVWPAIVTPDEHLRLRAVLTDPARRTLTAGMGRKLLTGLLVCGRCGAKLVSRPRDDRRPAYICARPPQGRGCGRIGTLAEPVHALILAAVFARLDSMPPASPPADDRALLDELVRLDERRTGLAAMWAAGEISAPEWRAAGAALDERTEAVRARVAAQTTSAAVAGDLVALEDRWPELGHERRRAILAAVIESVTVRPGVRGRNTFDPDRFTEIVWRV